MKIKALCMVLPLLAFAPPVLAQATIPPDRDGLLSGEGMGMASAAEQNGFPGPKHVLQLGEQLQLTPRQIETAKALAESVAVAAKALGKEIVRKETELSGRFKSNSVSEAELEMKLREIGRLRADLRNVHLRAHLRMKAALTTQQTELYSRLRGHEIKN